MTRLAAAALVLALGPLPQAADSGPALHLSQATAALGTYEIVSGSGWAPGVEVQLEICGIGPSSGDCDLQDAVSATAGATGAFTAHLQVNEPPTPCPCTVHAAPFAGAASTPADVPIAIPGLRYLPQAAQAVAGKASVLDVTVSPDSPPLAQLGAEGSAEVTVTFGNLSQGPAGDPGAALTLTRGGRPVGRYPLAWGSAPLPVGQTRRLVYDVPLPGGWFRDYGIGVALDSGAPVRTVGVAVRPWGELAAPSALLVGIGLIALGRKRRHANVTADEDDAVDEYEEDETTAIDEALFGPRETQAPESASESDSRAALGTDPGTEPEPEQEPPLEPDPAVGQGREGEGAAERREPLWEVMAMRRAVPPPATAASVEDPVGEEGPGEARESAGRAEATERVSDPRPPSEPVPRPAEPSA